MYGVLWAICQRRICAFKLRVDGIELYNDRTSTPPTHTEKRKKKERMRKWTEAGRGIHSKFISYSEVQTAVKSLLLCLLQYVSKGPSTFTSKLNLSSCIYGLLR
ncbi:hypothetical protein NLU13_0822 [Sarocladium strictum]|uniref:Uncharacterized protein n=1 Tax=Sarocladium strictum TaxID=5046 RepID=A0AA39LB60_SARSR|nr:hypothetical protein NLU13_0822 [Sarocladium strictum]